MSVDSLLTSSVPRTLETKARILGMELSDVLVLLLNLSFQNLVFGPTSLKLPMVFGSSVLLAVLLLFVKRGKPDGYLQHYIEYLLHPTELSANATDTKFSPFSQKGDL